MLLEIILGVSFLITPTVLLFTGDEVNMILIYVLWIITVASWVVLLILGEVDDIAEFCRFVAVSGAVVYILLRLT